MSKSKEQIAQLRRGSDRRFPQLGIKSGSIRNLQIEPPSLPQTERGQPPESVSKNESYLLHQLMSNVSKDKTMEGEDEADREEEGEEGDEDEHDELVHQQVEEEEEDQQEEEEEEEEDDDISMIGTITEWQDRLTYERMVSARDYVLYTFECLVTVCENRLELQDRIAQRCPFFFQALYGEQRPLSCTCSLLT
jgi:hypothetical protein